MNIMNNELLNQLLVDNLAQKVAKNYGTPVYIYSEDMLLRQAQLAQAMPNAFGLKVRYAMKANSNISVVRTLYKAGVCIDASSGYEVERALLAGVAPSDIQITAQELPNNIGDLHRAGVLVNACSLMQLEKFGAASQGGEVSLRINPGLGSGHTNRTNVGGISSSFGIWHEHLDRALEICKKYSLTVTRAHTHIGSGADPNVWKKVALMSLEMCRALPDVSILSLGGGFKIARNRSEEGADLQVIGFPVKSAFEDFYHATGRKLIQEIEPGAFLVGNAGGIISAVTDVVNTGNDGFEFIKLDTGMNDFIRPGMYGGIHEISTLSSSEHKNEKRNYLVVGHCCESSDILTPMPNDPDGVKPVELPEMKIGDLVVIAGTGAYCASMAAKNYNSFPESAEIMIRQDGAVQVVRRRQTLEQLIQNEINVVS
jgi:diaminopimelate decarboxylase